MAKWPKGISKKFNLAVRQTLVPIFKERGFEAMPPPGCDGEWNQFAYQTDLFRTRGDDDLDIAQICVSANRDELYATVEAVRATGYKGDTASLKELICFPLEERYRMPGRGWLGGGIYRLGPPWPEDQDKAISDLLQQMLKRLPKVFRYLDNGEERFLFGKKVHERWPLSKVQ